MVTTASGSRVLRRAASPRTLTGLFRRPVILLSLLALAIPAVLLGSETAASASPSITSVVVGGTQAAPSITVNGSGFGSDVSALGTAYPFPPDCTGLETGLDYGNNFHFKNDTQNWEAGRGTHQLGDNCIGVLFTAYSNTQIVFTLGSNYTTSSYHLVAGDNFTMHVLTATFAGHVPFIIPPTNPPVAATITPGQTATWAITIVNPYDSPMTSVNATLHAFADGSTPLAFADAGMPGCSADAELDENCALPDIPAHSSQSFEAFVTTGTLGVGTAISGDISVASNETATTNGTLGTVTIVACGAACVIGVADPGTPLASSPGPPTDTHPTKQIVTLPGNNPDAPPVAVTLNSVNPGPKTTTFDKQLCPLSGIKCSGQISVIGGNFTKYNSKAHPIRIQIVMKWKTAIPPGRMIMTKLVGPPVQLPPCVVKQGLYNTPCAKPEVKTGSLATKNLTTIDTIFFVGTDPHVARRAANVPDAPTAVKAVAAKKSAVVTWKAPVVTNGPITGYIVTPHLGRVALPLINVTGLKRTVTGLVTGKSYTFTVAAKNRHGISYQSIASKAIKVK